MDQIAEKLDAFKKEVEKGRLPKDVAEQMNLGPANVVLRIMRKNVGEEKFKAWLHQYVMPLRYEKFVKRYLDHVDTIENLERIELITEQLLTAKREEING